MVLDAETLKIIYRSALRPRSPKDPNKRLVDAGGKEDHQPHSKPTKHPTPVPDGEKSAQPANPTVYIKSRHDDGPTSSKSLPKWDSNHKKILNTPPHHQKIRVNLIFAVKHNGRHKARLVADGSLTSEPVENIYSGVVSLRHLRLVIFLGELNNLELRGADIGNAYLEAYTHEKLFIIAGPEFEELEGFILIFNKALYGLKSSGKSWMKGSMTSSRTWDSHLPKQIHVSG